MSKTIKTNFYDKLTFDKLLEAHNRSKKFKGMKEEVMRYEMDLENNLASLLKNIKNNTYTLGKYKEFVIKEPKERIIKSLPYKDRIVHQWYVEEFIKPYFIKRFMKDSYACIENRGTHKAVEQLQKYMRIMKHKYGKYYVLKCDIKKYFYSINKDILIKILKKYISNKKIIQFSELLIRDGEDKGIPIGNYTSQYYANIYLNELDQYMKHILHIKYVVRYMDDFVILVKEKKQAFDLKEKISNFINNELDLKLNKKTCYYPNNMGVDFCGYRIYETHLLLRKRSKQKIKKNIKKWNKLYNYNKLDLSKTRSQLNSWLAHSKHASSYNFRNHVFKKIEFDCNILQSKI